MARNTNRQGAGFELDIMHYLTGCQIRPEPCATKNHAGWTGYGYDAGRSSGSRGKVDVWAISPYVECVCGCGNRDIPDVPMLLIQAKITAHPLRTPLAPDERRILMDLATRAGAIALTASKAKDATTGRVRPHFRRLTGSGPRDWESWEPGEEL